MNTLALVLAWVGFGVLTYLLARWFFTPTYTARQTTRREIISAHRWALFYSVAGPIGLIMLIVVLLISVFFRLADSFADYMNAEKYR